MNKPSFWICITCGGLMGGLLANMGFPFYTWQFWAICLLSMMIQISRLFDD